MALQPGGLLAPDPGALSPAQLEQLREFKIQTRIANEKYLRTHKEVELLLSAFFRHHVGFLHQKLPHSISHPLWKFVGKLIQKIVGEMLLKRPDNIREFAAEYFTDPRLPNKIHMQLIKEKKAA